MTNPLTSLDELIWKQFEKVTVAANKKLGWNKYDLVTVTDNISNITLLGGGVYFGMYGAITKSSVLTTIGAVATVVAPIHYSFCKSKNQREEDKELEQIIKTGAVREPVYEPLRPLRLIGWSNLLPVGAATLFFSERPSQFTFLIGASCMLIGLTHIINVASDYFRSQIMTPPAAKKNLWKAVTDYITKPFHNAAPQPVESGVKYQTIDDYVSSAQSLNRPR